MGKQERMSRSANGSELFKNPIVGFPNLFKQIFHFCNIVCIDAVGGVYSTGNLIKVVACAAEQGYEVTQFGQLQFYHIMSILSCPTRFAIATAEKPISIKRDT